MCHRTADIQKKKTFIANRLCSLILLFFVWNICVSYLKPLYMLLVVDRKQTWKNHISVPGTFYFTTWTVSKRWAHAERMMSVFWTNNECTLNSVSTYKRGKISVCRAQTKCKVNGVRTANDKWTLCERKINDLFEVPLEYILILYFVGKQEKKPKWLPYPASCSAKFFYHILFFTKHLYLHVGIRVQKRQKWRRWYFYKRVIE